MNSNQKNEFLRVFSCEKSKLKSLTGWELTRVAVMRLDGLYVQVAIYSDKELVQIL